MEGMGRSVTGPGHEVDPGGPVEDPGRPVTGQGHDVDLETPASATESERLPRPFVERLGLAAVALFVGGLFTLMAGAAWVGQEGFLAVMAGLGGVMTFWAGFSTLRRG